MSAAAWTSSETMNGTDATTSNSSGLRRAPSRAKPSFSASRYMSSCCGENSIATQPSQISAASAMFFGPSAAR